VKGSISTTIYVEKRIKTLGLPPLGPKKGSTLDPSKNNNHQEASFSERELKLVKDAPIFAVDNSAVWGSEKQIATGWTSESQIQHYVNMVLTEIVEMTGLGNVISYQNELDLFELRYSTPLILI
jgi:hypothetical protein